MSKCKRHGTLRCHMQLLGSDDYKGSAFKDAACQAAGAVL